MQERAFKNIHEGSNGCLKLFSLRSVLAYFSVIPVVFSFKNGKQSETRSFQVFLIKLFSKNVYKKHYCRHLPGQRCRLPDNLLILQSAVSACCFGCGRRGVPSWSPCDTTCKSNLLKIVMKDRMAV
jgi:hypothetical protein